MKIRLKNITQDPKLLELRKVQDRVVSKYREAMRNGARFPAIVIDQNRVVVSGNHRYMAMLQEYGEEHFAIAVKKKLVTQKERLEFFVKENSTHGYPLDTFSKNKISCELIRAGATKEEVAKLLGVAVKKVIFWGDNQIMVTLGSGGFEYRSIKHGVGNTHRPMTEEEHKEHVDKDIGIAVSQQVNQLLRWLSYDRVARTKRNTELLEELYELLQDWLYTSTTEELIADAMEDAVA
jgi:hypothetical protein